MNKLLIVLGLIFYSCSVWTQNKSGDKVRVIVTSDGEIDDECSMVRFLLYTNEWDVEGIVTSSSQYHWHGHNWAGDDWLDPYLEAYSEVFPNLLLHDSAYPTPEYLKSVSFLGNVDAEGEMDAITPGSQHIVNVLLDESDDRPVWLQAWGGTNTIARALKTIEEEHASKMEYVANKIRFFFIWEQDSTYQSYIRTHWGKYNILTIISDQFWAIAYQWNKILPEDKQTFFRSDWMKSNILEGHGALCSLYKAHVPGSHGLSGDTAFHPGDFRSEGDSPAFLHTIPTGLKNIEFPDYGGWGGRYIKVLENTWLDPVPFNGYEYPEGRWYTRSAWGRKYMREQYPENQDQMQVYFKPLVRWADAIQRDFAARADWCVQSFREANHPPVPALSNPEEFSVKSGERFLLDAAQSTDPDGDELSFLWFQFPEAGTCKQVIRMEPKNGHGVYVTAPEVEKEETAHFILKLTDKGTPALTRYKRVIVTFVPE